MAIAKQNTIQAGEALAGGFALADVPTVEERLYSARKNAALLRMLFTALATSEDVMMSKQEREDAWARLSYLMDDMRADLLAAMEAGATSDPAPDVTEAE